MNKRLTIFSVSLLFCTAIAYSVIIKPHATSPKNFALIEYFTSDACYRCPPADEIVNNMAKEYAGKNVYVLAYHVDYRDDSVWKDKFSQPAFSERQRKYGRRFRLFSVYTPQVIVNGKKELVGSDKELLYSSLYSALTDTAASTLEIHTAGLKSDSLKITFNVKAYKENILNIALVQNTFEQTIERGANRGKTIQYSNTVRELKSIPFIGKKEGTALLPIPSGLSISDMKVIAFVQNRNTLAVTSVTSVPAID